MREKSQKMSLLINTRNRCNGPNSEPFSWAVKSIRMQSLEVPVIILDDHSDREHSTKLSEICNYNNFEYYRTSKPEGCNASRRIALNLIKTPWHLILDDDSVFVKSNALESIESTVLELEKQDGKTAAIVFPSYDRTPFPARESSTRYIGRIEFEKGITYWNMNTQPIETVEGPLSVDTLGAYGAFNTCALRTVKGFGSGGVSEFSMESDLGWRLRREGFTLYYSPSIEQSSMHLKWGVKMEASISQIIESMSQGLKQGISDREQVDNLEELFDRQVDGITFREMIERADQPSTGGCRTNEASWIYERVSNEFYQILKYYPLDKRFRGAINYIKRVLQHARLDKISSRRGSFAEPCNRDSLDYRSRRNAVIKGLSEGLIRKVISHG